MFGIRIKPMTVNQAWQGKRFKTPKYKAYERELLLLLPPNVEIPEGDLSVEYIFCLSSPLADWDNPIKPFQDILQKKYGFDDRRIHKAIVTKKLVEKGQECVFFRIQKLYDN